MFQFVVRVGILVSIAVVGGLLGLGMPEAITSLIARVPSASTQALAGAMIGLMLGFTVGIRITGRAWAGPLAGADRWERLTQPSW